MKRVNKAIGELKHTLRSRMARAEAGWGLLFAAPWLLGFLIFTLWPIVFSIVLSFSEWDPYAPVSHMKIIGLGNFVTALTKDKNVPLALWNTFTYAIFAVPLGLATSLGLAMLLNQKVRGITLFRTVFYVPSIVGGVATSILWIYIFNPLSGPLNSFLRSLNHLLDYAGVMAGLRLPEPMWLGDPHWMKPAIIIMYLWGAGGAGMLIFLAGLQGVPDQLYEVAELDGAGRFRKFWNVTLPMITPTIFFNLVMGIIGALQVFMQAYVLTQGNGGPDGALMFYVLYLYQKAFVEYDMGYASALAWILFVIILLLTLLVMKSSKLWLYYEGDNS